MSRRRFDILTIFVAVVCVGYLGVFGASAREPQVSTRFVPDTIMIGDQFAMELDIEKDVAQEIQLPQFEDNQLTKQLEILGIDRVDTISLSDRRIKIRVTYRMTSFDEGSHSVGRFPVVWSSSIADASAGKGDTVFAVENMRLTVGTFEIDTTKQQIFDIKRPISTPLIWDEVKELVLWGVVVAILLAVIIYLIIKYVRRRQGKSRRGVIIPPHIVAIRELEKLHSKKLWQNEKHKDYYSALTDIVRVYIERRYGIGAMEMTSDEIMNAVQVVNDKRLREKLKVLFVLADFVKFAKMTPSAEDNEQAYFDAYFYVEETKEVVEQVTAPGVNATEVTKPVPSEKERGVKR